LRLCEAMLNVVKYMLFIINFDFAQVNPLTSRRNAYDEFYFDISQLLEVVSPIWHSGYFIIIFQPDIRHTW